MNEQQMREATAEGIGTFMLVLVGAGAVALNPGNLLVAALAHGLILVAIISTYGHISGAHVNPAVTLGLLVGGKINLNKATSYWIAQIIGALVACVVLRVVVPVDSALQRLGQTAPAADVNALGVVVIEGILTFFLVSTVYQVAVYGHSSQIAPLLIGLTLAGAILLGGPLTGASLNPARTLGPALLAEDGQDIGEVFTYMIGIFTGGALAGILHSDTFKLEEKSTAAGVKKTRKS